MFTHHSRRVLRSLLSLCAAALLVLAGAALVPASADTPAAWEKAPDVSPLGFLMVLLILPLGAAVVITLLTVLPSLSKDKGYEPGQSWRGESEWFGGPTKGLSAADSVAPEAVESSSKDAGGTSGRW